MTPSQRELDSLKSCCLLSETEQNLKSLGDYKAAVENAIDLYPALKRHYRGELNQ